MKQARITHRGETRSASAEPGAWQPVLDEMIARLGPWDPTAGSTVELVETVEPEPTVVEKAAAFGPGLSEFGATVHDQAAANRYAAFDAAIKEQTGRTVDRSSQLYASGTRMAGVGYENQDARRKAFERDMPLREAAAELSATITAEKRRDIIITAGEAAAQISMNGAVKWGDFKLREHAIRGLLARLESPALKYVLGLRDRMIGPDVTENGKRLDKDALVDVLQRELRRFPDIKLKFRAREGLGDVFATVSPDYTEADAPRVLPVVVDAMPDGVRGRFRYNAVTTRWDLQASVFTPTPVHEQAVGEPFQAYSSISSGDGGANGIDGGGGFWLLACLNAMAYQAELAGLSSRNHRGNVMRDVRRLVRESMVAIEAIIGAWGTARTTVVERPTDKHEVLIPIETAIPGFYRAMLTARRGELVGVLPGRTETHVAGLAQAYMGERRNPQDVTRADLANGYTRYIQGQPLPVQLDAEAAIGRWIVNPRGEKLSYIAA